MDDTGAERGCCFIDKDLCQSNVSFVFGLSGYRASAGRRARSRLLISRSTIANGAADFDLSFSAAPGQLICFCFVFPQTGQIQVAVAAPLAKGGRFEGEQKGGE